MPGILGAHVLGHLHRDDYGVEVYCLAVAVAGECNDFAVYHGCGFGSQVHAAHTVAETGDKMPESWARAMFPSLSHLAYRD